MQPRDPGRRRTLKILGAATVAGAFAGPRWLAPAGAAAEAGALPWNKDAFAAQSVDEVIKALGAKDPARTSDISWGATPEIAENGAVVPVSVTSRIPNTASIALIIEKNPNKLAANFHFPETAQPALVTRVKLSESSNVHALIRTRDEKFFLATREIKVTLGGCGG